MSRNLSKEQQKIVEFIKQNPGESLKETKNVFGVEQINNLIKSRWLEVRNKKLFYIK